MDDLRKLYLDLLKKTLTHYLWVDMDYVVPQHEYSQAAIQTGRGPDTVPLVESSDRQAREEGTDWPFFAHTMVGLHRLDNIQFCVESVLRDGVPGDLVETGVWRGGASIFMRAVLRAHGVTDRIVWVADSFEGLPRPSGQYPADKDDFLYNLPFLAASLEEVKANFERYGMLDGQVRFLKGWFRDTLPGAPIERIAVLRLDGDMYESTMDALGALYDRLSPGGYLIIDDYGAIPACRQAVDDFRLKHDIDEEMLTIDWTGVYWRRRAS